MSRVRHKQYLLYVAQPTLLKSVQSKNGYSAKQMFDSQSHASAGWYKLSETSRLQIINLPNQTKHFGSQ